MKRHTPFPTLDHVWLFAAVAMVALQPLLTPVPPNDFWWHMATGRLIVAHGSVPLTDSFSFTQAGQPFFNQSWLAQVLMYGLYQLGGVSLLLVVQAVVLAFAYWLILQICLWRSDNTRLSVGLLLLATLPLSLANWLIRPQLYAFPLFTAFLAILTAYRIGRFNRLWLLPLLMVLWVNIHGSFVLGGVLIALTVVSEWLRRQLVARQERMRWATEPIGAPEDVLARTPKATEPPLLPVVLWGAITALAIAINPRGIAVFGYVRNLVGSSSVTTLVTEWASPTIRNAGGLIFFLFLFLCIGVLTYARRRPDLVDLLIAATFLWLSLGAVRNVVWFGMVATPLLATQLATIIGTDSEGSSKRTNQELPALNWMLIGVLALLVVLGLPWIKPFLNLPPQLGALIDQNTPVETVACMQQQSRRPERLFNSMAYGSYLIWQAPEQKVFIDPRIEFYPYAQWRDYINLSAGHEVAQLMERYRFDGALLDNGEQATLLALLKADPNWQIVCSDQHSTYFIRR